MCLILLQGFPLCGRHTGKGEKVQFKNCSLITTRCHPTPVRMVAISQVMTSVGVDKDRSNPHALLVRIYTGAATVEDSMAGPKELKIEPP